MRKAISVGLIVLGMVFGTKVQATDVSGNVSGNWTLAGGSPYVVTANATVTSGTTLVIDPSVEVRFTQNTSLIVEGRLTAIGTSVGTITFTGQSATPGYWQSIKFSGSNAKGTISYCEIRYAKQAVYLENVSGIVITHNYIHDNKGDDGAWGYVGQPGQMGCGIYLSSSTDNAISDNTISSNQGGNGGRSGYCVTGGAGGIGTGIYLLSSTNNTISENTIFSNQGGSGGRDGYVGGGPGGAGGVGCGIYLSSSTNDTISGNTISNNTGGQRGNPGYNGGYGSYSQGYGIYSCSNSFPIIYYNTLSGNKKGDGTKGFGVYHDGSSGTISATLNWWGANLGPYHPTTNLSGQGNQVSDYVDYRPWIGITSVVPSQGPVSTTVTIEGVWFATQTKISLSFGTHPTITTTQSSSNGTFSCTFLVPTQPGGTKIITATDSLGNQATTTFFILPKITRVNPEKGQIGTEVALFGSGFFAQSTISVDFGTYPTIITTQSSINGTFSTTFKVSAQSPGIKVITAQDTSGNLATTTFFIIPQITQLNPSFSIAGKEITVCGSSFFENSLVTISFSTHLTITTTQSSINGTFSATFIVDTQTPGTKVITATDTEGNLATTLFILLPPTFLKILPSYKIIAKNQEFDVEVKIDDVRNLKGAEVHLSFDPNVLEVLSLSEGGFPSGGFVIKGTNSGKIDYTVILLSDSATGSGLLCSARFKGKNAGTTSIRFDFDQAGNRMTRLADTQNQMIPFNKDESLVYVAGVLSVSPENKVILSGNNQSYSAFAICEAGSVNVTGSATFTASGGGSFTINIFEAHYIGTYTISAQFLGLTGTTSVYITPGTPTSLLYVSGNNQTSTCTTTLANPFVVKVEDFYHNPCLGVFVSFVVISSPPNAEGYSLSSTETLTNLNGTTSSYLTLGDEPPGSYTIRASSGSLTPFDFTAWSLRRFGNIAGICLIDYGTEGQRTASITVTLIETSATITTNSNSYFIFSNILVGTYTLSFTYPGATPATKTNVVITQTQVNDTTDIGTITLIMGDPNGDGQINMLDLQYIADSNAYGSQQGDPNYNPACDFNSDGQINLLDLLILADNFWKQQQEGKGMKAKTKTRDRAIALRFEPNSIDNARIGQIITMNILVSGAKDSYGGEVHLSFNPEVLALQRRL